MTVEEPQEKQPLIAVGAELAGMIARDYRAAGHGDCPTLVTAVGGLMGEAALFYAARHLPPSGWIDDSAANHLIYGAGSAGRPSIWGYVRMALVDQYGVSEASLPKVETVAQSVSAAVGRMPFPVLNVPQGYEPGRSPLEAGPLLRAQAHEVGRSAHLAPLELCYALAEAAIVLIIGHRDITPLPISTRLTLESMVAAARVVPAPILRRSESEAASA